MVEFAQNASRFLGHNDAGLIVPLERCSSDRLLLRSLAEPSMHSTACLHFATPLLIFPGVELVMSQPTALWVITFQVSSPERPLYKFHEVDPSSIRSRKRSRHPSSVRSHKLSRTASKDQAHVIDEFCANFIEPSSVALSVVDHRLVPARFDSVGRRTKRLQYRIESLSGKDQWCSEGQAVEELGEDAVTQYEERAMQGEIVGRSRTGTAGEQLFDQLDPAKVKAADTVGFNAQHRLGAKGDMYEWRNEQG